MDIVSMVPMMIVFVDVVSNRERVMKSNYIAQTNVTNGAAPQTEGEE